jgi:alpha-galactosidase
VQLGRASKPADLLTYQKEDLEPSIFVLKESDRQTMVAIFNWTEGSRSHDLPLSQLGLNAQGSYDVTEVLAATPGNSKVQGTLHVEQPAHSVRLLKLIDASAPAQTPVAKIASASSGRAGADLNFEAAGASEINPVLRYRWDFGDGTVVEGKHLTHAYTRSGNYQVTLTAIGLGESSAQAHASVSVSGALSTRFHPETQRRLPPEAR